MSRQSLAVCLCASVEVPPPALMRVGMCVYVCLCTSSTTSGVIMHYPTRDQCLALSSTRVLLLNVITVMYAWLHMHFVSSVMLTVQHDQCLPAISQHLLMTPAFSSTHHGEGYRDCYGEPHWNFVHDLELYIAK